MKTSLTILGFGLFVWSLFLPTIFHTKGYFCIIFLTMMWEEGPGYFLYILPYVFSNLLMFTVPGLLLTSYRNKPIPMILIIAHTIFLFHSLWLGMDAGGVGTGFALYVLSTLMVIFAAMLSRKKGTVEPDNSNQSS